MLLAELRKACSAREREDHVACFLLRCPCDVHGRREGDVGDAAHLVDQVVGDPLVRLEHGVGSPAALGAEGAHGGDVEPARSERPGERCEHAGFVAVGDEDRGQLALDVDAHAVDAADADAAAAERLALHHDGASLRGMHGDAHGVGVERRVVSALDDREDEAGFLRQRERVAHALVVGVEAEDARHERLVGAVATMGAREGVEQGEVNPCERTRCQQAGDARDAERSRGVRARRAHHNGAEHLERGHSHGHPPDPCMKTLNCTRPFLTFERRKLSAEGLRAVDAREHVLLACERERLADAG